MAVSPSSPAERTNMRRQRAVNGVPVWILSQGYPWPPQPRDSRPPPAERQQTGPFPRNPRRSGTERQKKKKREEAKNKRQRNLASSYLPIRISKSQPEIEV
ncbi:hypothetical protein H112_03148 [Trichophyton rubrum D6]|uniref:Uncharacterized protein n=2 Tax=Trichophyton TaxID=5550 RepID=A0A022W7S0_TRIRU|nr:hypothetical protein H100_03152 [Trichophyton rubrum MR850]EZF43362.1 hypothetical protein H102_03146 [Trichophyton rubrum CBS 100081]EZF54083.1 hypothetical protein H103_03160 [Trichophyton rubrum CBS 288.86]EZF64610.1 hypothetical protein H104_03142 [Trichophyton rubrum CBS 289.86]EZF75266.1 hypothetical protein H105_03165 [Trichophyton soudanense CBS 452.61]EZF85988.1 hypothetical protein H110_03153 [Trichophyton rubrum MR1448]EZG18199.1 hypothetical protein H107_03254 [Trichophyton rub